MSLAQYELSEQSLDNVSDWLESSPNSRASHRLSYQHYSLKPNSEESLQLSLSRCFALQSIPVIFSNCHETLLDVMESMPRDGEALSVINIGKSLCLKPSLELNYGSAYQFLLSQNRNAKVMYLGVDENSETEMSFERAEDFGCKWLPLSEYRAKNRNAIHDDVQSCLARADQAILVVDLDSLHPKHELDSRVIDIGVVSNTIEQCMLSDKLRFVLLVGHRDNAIYSRETKGIYQQIKALSSQVSQRV